MGNKKELMYWKYISSLVTWSNWKLLNVDVFKSAFQTAHTKELRYVISLKTSFIGLPILVSELTL